MHSLFSTTTSTASSAQTRDDAMPFDRYLVQQQRQPPSQSSYNASGRVDWGVDQYSNAVQFQMPQFILGGPPTLAHGGGAEVLPGLSASAWFSNSGFQFDPSSYSSSSKQPYLPSPSSSSSNEIQNGVASSYPPHTSSYAAPSHHPEMSRSVLPADYGYSDNNTVSPPSQSKPVDQRSFSLPIQSPTSGLKFPLDPTASFTIPSAMGLPVYSPSGFDFLSVLARVITRAKPRIVLGPVDMTCSFTVADVRRFDAPIVYASPSFYRLSGYEEHEVLGKNCRFLQSPDGRVQKGDERRFTSAESVRYMKKCLIADKECQTTLVNYKKGGHSFVNLVTVIPITGGVNNRPEESDEVVYHVGFQVNLTEQPDAIVQKMSDGSYVVNYGAGHSQFPPSSVGRRLSAATSHVMSEDLRALLANPKFCKSIPLTTESHASPPNSGGAAHERLLGEKNEPDGGHGTSHPLNLLLLETAPDFIHVLSLKGSFLYVAPSVRRVLGFEPDELVGKSIVDYCHPHDVVPLMRELKESATTPSGVAGIQPPKKVDLLFRAQTKAGGWVWCECRGRLHVEPGKGRKAIILSGRARDVPRLTWGEVARAGGLVQPEMRVTGSEEMTDADEEDVITERRAREVWAGLSPAGTFLFVGSGIKDVLGWDIGELVGRTMADVVDRHSLQPMENALVQAASVEQTAEPGIIPCHMLSKDDQYIGVHVVVYPAEPHASDSSSCTMVPAPILCQIKLADASGTPSGQMTRPQASDVFQELNTAQGSSWQYELQQLRFSNQRLMEEIEALEAELQQQATPSQASLPPASSLPPSRSSQSYSSMPYAHSSLYTHQPAAYGDWKPYTQDTVLAAQSHPQVQSTTAKRPWYDMA